MKRAFESYQSEKVVKYILDLKTYFNDFGEHLSGNATQNGFADAVSIWVNKPHVVNRRLCGAKILQFCRYSIEDGGDFIQKRFELAVESVLKNQIPEKEHGASLCIEIPSLSTLSKGDNMVIVRDVYPKHTDKYPVVREVISYDADTSSAWFCPVTDTFSCNADDKIVTASTSPCYQLLHIIQEGRFLLRVGKSDDASGTCELVTSGTSVKPAQRNLSNNNTVLVHLPSSSTESQKNQKKSELESSGTGSVKGNTELVKSGTQNVSANTEIVTANAEIVTANAEIVTTNTEIVTANAEIVTANTEIVTENTEIVTADPEIVTADPEIVTAHTEQTLTDPCTTCSELVTTSKEVDTSSLGMLSCDWLKENLLPKIVKWSEVRNLQTTVTSLRLVEMERYNAVYKLLKEKHGKKFVKDWPEKTDPQKFVYEDVAIATYLLVLWEQERMEKNLTKKQSFVDLGCGNGLLVHILTAEGHPGVGLDIRKRTIWDLYGPETKLEVKEIIPSIDSLYPQYDWLIGNHSDELTPWIPVMAARSSYTCRYFVLPCCPFDFDRKFNQKMTGKSSYRGYLDWVTEVGVVCGFTVEEDTLRIPSTKRVCFIGKTRTYSEDDESVMDDKRTEYIKSRCKRDIGQLKRENSDLKSKGDNSAGVTENLNSDGSHSDKKKPRLDGEKSEEKQQWASNFQPRDSVERTRNCQSVKRETKELIVNKVFSTIMAAEDAEVRETSDGRTWHKGGSIPMSDVARMFDQDVLQQLKSECGGLQTLLRNHNMIFNVSSGKVQLRDMTMALPFSKHSKLGKTKKRKTLLCWFHVHHRDGCPRSKDSCMFAHGEGDLVQNKMVTAVIP